MNLLQMQSELQGMLGWGTYPATNANPLFPLIYPAIGNEPTNILLRAANRLVRMAIGANENDCQLFPELHTSWTNGPTIVGQCKFDRPPDAIAVQKVHSARQAAQPGDQWSDIAENPVTVIIDPSAFGLLNKNNTSDYASLYTLKGKEVLYSPVTDADHIDWFRVYGIGEESPISSPTSSFKIAAALHPVVITLAASLMAEKLGWAARSQSWLSSVVYEITHTINPSLAQFPQHFEVHIEDTPTWGSVNEGWPL